MTSIRIVANSLEEIHDNIHDCVGGAGHMGDPAYAGSSPYILIVLRL